MAQSKKARPRSDQKAAKAMTAKTAVKFRPAKAVKDTIRPTQPK